MTRFPMVQPVTEMTRAALGRRLAPGVDAYLDMFHEHAVFEFPFGVGGPARIVGRSATAKYLQTIEGSTVFERFNLNAVYPIGYDMALGYHAQARTGEEGRSFTQLYNAIIKANSGRIYSYREYLNPLNTPGVEIQRKAVLETTPLEGKTTNLDRILKVELGDRNVRQAQTFLDMFSVDGTLECPFAPSGAVRRVNGQAAVSNYYQKFVKAQGSDGMVLIERHDCEPSRHVILDYEGNGSEQERWDALLPTLCCGDRGE